MVYKSNWNQERIKHENRQAILHLLNEYARTFTELKDATEFSPMGLTKMLADLVKDGKIEKRDPKNKKSAYVIKGSATQAKELLFPGYKISEAKDSGKFYVDLPSHLESEISNFAPLFGMTSYVVYNTNIKKQFRPFWRKEMFGIEKFVYEQLYSKIKSGLPIIKEKNGKIFLILEIDYDNIVNIVNTRSKEENERLVKDKIEELKALS